MLVAGRCTAKRGPERPAGARSHVSQPLVEVILPTNRGSEFLPATLESVSIGSANRADFVTTYLARRRVLVINDAILGQAASTLPDVFFLALSTSATAAEAISVDANLDKEASASLRSRKRPRREQ